MVTHVRTLTRTTQGSIIRRRRVAVATAMLAALAGTMTVGTSSPASAIPVDVGWQATGPGTISDVSDGSASAARFSYSLQPAGLGQQRTWTFSAVATQTGQVKVPYTWQGLHAWFAVTTSLDTFVTHPTPPNPPSTPDTTTHILGQGPTSCCTAPSNGFIYGGVATFDVQAGETYGFRLSGSNSDSNNFLRGTLTLSTKPYLDATIGDDNRDWPGAVDLASSAPTDRAITAAGEARWFMFPVVPGQDVRVTLNSVASGKDYDLALYSDIEAAYDQLSGDDPTSAGTSATAGVGDDQTLQYPEEVAEIPTKANPPEGRQFAPRIYAPRIYAPRIYAPRIYAPRIYAPRIYAPRIYAPDSYIPELVSDESFQEAFSAAQNQTLLAVGSQPGTSEVVNASSGNTNGNFYVRVQGHGNQDFDAAHAFTLTATASGSGCGTLDPKTGEILMPPIADDAPSDPATVIVTDRLKTNYALDEEQNEIGSPELFIDELEKLGDATQGVVVDLADSDRVQALWEQADAQNDCPYAVNLVAAAIDEIIANFRNGNSSYVVLAGGDDVVPFFRYPDVSGLGPESQFSPPMREGTAADGSLERDQVLSQDAYGSDTDVTIAGTTLPVPDLAVGRLVKTDQEISSQIENFLALTNQTLPAPTSSLVTGYDFLTDAANEVNEQFQQALGPEAPADAADTLISDNADPDDVPWNATQLESKLLGGPKHDIVFLAGHFSANDTLAADFDTSLNARLLAPDGVYAGHLKNTLVLSAGCHSGYNIVDRDAIVGVTEKNDWTQRMAQQGALLVGGTGYQYGDTDFLEYSERLYLELRPPAARGARHRSDRGRQGPGAGQAGLPRGSRHRLRHRPEGAAPGNPLRPADDRLRRPRAEPHRRRGRWRRPDRRKHCARQPARPPGGRQGLRHGVRPRLQDARRCGADLARGPRRRRRPAGRARAAEADRGRQRRRRRAPRDRLPQWRLPRRLRDLPADRCPGHRGVDPELHVRVRLLLPAEPDDRQLLRHPRVERADVPHPDAGAVPHRQPHRPRPAHQHGAGLLLDGGPALLHRDRTAMRRWPRRPPSTRRAARWPAAPSPSPRASPATRRRASSRCGSPGPRDRTLPATARGRRSTWCRTPTTRHCGPARSR